VSILNQAGPPEPLPTWKTSYLQSLSAFSSVRLVVVDVDGTILEPEKLLRELSDTIPNLVRTLRKNRHRVHFTIATGRTLAGVRPLLERLPLKNIPIILYNGSLILEVKSILTGESYFSIIEQKTIPAQSLREILFAMSNYLVRTVAYFYDDPIYAPKQSPWEQETVIGWSQGETVEREFNGMPVKWQEGFSFDGDTGPTAILVDISEEIRFGLEIEKELSIVPGVSLTRSGRRYIELRPNGSNKGVALELISRRLALSREEVLAIGDNDNDSEMLAWAGIGVAVAKASSAAMGSSNYVAHYGVFEGAIEVLQLVYSAKRYWDILRIDGLEDGR
jgi:Cof subfamily protein (haloacid dehalogenase superfamily)